MADTLIERGAGSVDGGSTDNILTASGELDARRSQTELRLPGGQVLRVPTAFLLKQGGRAGANASENRAPANDAQGAEPLMIPVIEEQLEISKRTVVTGTVVLERATQEYTETLDEPLLVRGFEVERIARNELVPSAPPVRQEGDTTIYSLVEEQLVLTTQLLLREEIRVTRRDTERRDTRTVTLSRDVLTVTRTPATGDGASGDRASDEQAAKDRASDEQAAKDRATNDRSAGNRSSKDRATGTSEFRGPGLNK